ncbi:hypothetical protein BsWGS_04546 [Bradybaena similaris]
MDTDTASQFVSCLVRCIQAFCHGYVQFSSSIEIVGHIYLNVDKGSKFNYIVNEEVSKSPGNHSTVYHTNSYHSLPPARDILLKMSSHQNHGVELDSRVKSTESCLDTTSSALPTSIENKVSAAIPVRLIKNERASGSILEVCSQNLPYEEYKNNKAPSLSTSTSILEVCSQSQPREEYKNKAPSLSSTSASILEVYSQSLPHEEYKNNKAPSLSSTSAGLPKGKTHSKPSQKQEIDSALDPSICIKQEPEMPFIHEQKHVVEDSLVADEPCEDDDKTVILPHPVINPRRLECTGLELLACNMANLPADCDSVSYDTASSHPTKSLSVQTRQQIVAYADIVGNRPAARHFGVNESSIRHWRKQFGMNLQGNGVRRGRKRRGDYLQDMKDEMIQASSMNADSSD